MKKYIWSLGAALLMLMFLIVPDAHADMYCNLNSAAAGVELNNLAVATVAHDSYVMWDALPQGCSIFSESREDGIHLYLSGTPLEAGTQQFTLTVDNTEGRTAIVCSIDIIPAFPVVYTGADLECCLGDSAPVSVIASVADGGALSYQWYSNSVSGTGNGRAISGANSATFYAPTDTEGTRYYYCAVTNTNSGFSNTALSAPVAVTVRALTVDSISVYSMPEKTEYTAGSEVQQAGLRVQIRYSDGSTDVIEQGFGLSPTRFDKVGAQSVEVSYQGKTCRFPVNVVSKSDSVQGIGVLTLPKKVKYEKGDTLESEGLSVRVYSPDGHYDVSTGLECSPVKLDTAGTQTITVSYMGKSCTFSVNVEETKKPVSAAVLSMPAKLQYAVGEKLDTAGLVLTLINSDQKTEQVKSGFICEPMLLENTGRQRIVVSYGELRCEFYVTVSEKTEPTPPAESTPVDKNAEAAAEPGVQPGVQTETPQGSHVIRHSSHESGADSKLMKIIVAAAVLALAVLGVSVLIVSHGGIENVVRELFRRQRGGRGR